MIDQINIQVKQALDMFSAEGLLTILSDPQNLQLIFAVVLVSFVVIFILGLTNIVIIFKNEADLVWSISTVAVPLVGICTLIYFQPDPKPIYYNFFFETNAATVVSVGMALLTCLSILMVFVYSLGNNGLVLGIPIGIFKIVSSGIILVFALGLFGKLFDKNGKDFRSLFLVTILFGFLWFFVRKMINGKTVNP